MTRKITAALIALAIFGGAAAHATENQMLIAADNCYAVGQRVAAQRGAQLASAQAVSGGCKIVLIIPGGNGQRPKRVEMVVNG
ncbi:hypothetical protein [Oricola sp.]|uniref:hypothetical protein n=1 Tax=Oricola sp. TaxID=1979950 RepID=UPI003BAA02C9